MLQSRDDEAGEWDEWIAKASSGPFSSYRLGRLLSRLQLHVRTRNLENDPQGAAMAQQRVDRIDEILRSRGT